MNGTTDGTSGHRDRTLLQWIRSSTGERGGPGSKRTPRVIRIVQQVRSLCPDSDPVLLVNVET